MTLSKAVELYLQEVRVTRRFASRSKATAAAYDSDLHRLVALAGMNTVLAFTPDLVRLYFTTESQRGNDVSTLHRKLSTLREFAKWGRKHRLWATDPRCISRRSNGRSTSRARSSTGSTSGS